MAETKTPLGPAPVTPARAIDLIRGLLAGRQFANLLAENELDALLQILAAVRDGDLDG